MKEKIGTIKELLSNQERKNYLYFGFYFVFFLLIFAIILVSNANKTVNTENTCENIDITKNSEITNYEFRYDININDQDIVLYGSRYKNEYIINKRIEGLVTKYYINYYDTYIYDDNDNWILTKDPIIEGFDRKLINEEYLKESIEISTEGSKTEDFISYYNESDDVKINIYYKDDEVDYREVIKDETSVKIRVFDVGLIEKFDIFIEEQSNKELEENI